MRSLIDILRGWSRHELWRTLGLQDIKSRYRRSVIGPFWITISMGVMVAALGIVYGGIFDQELADYLPYLAAGFVMWAFIASILTEGTNVFIGSQGLIKLLPAPLSIHVFKMLASNAMILVHNLMVFVVVAVIFELRPGIELLMIIPAVLCVLFNGVWISILLGLLSARFRDVPLVVSSVVQVMFFLTPVIWRPEMLINKRPMVLELNPFYHFMEILRAPLLGDFASTSHWIVIGCITAGGWITTLIVFEIYKKRLAYWI